MSLTSIAFATGLETAPRPRRLRVALAGNPNCGKSSLFNALTGARQHVANYPGVTVEMRTGTFEIEGEPADVVDLPGTYGLSAFSPEERVAEEELASRPDVVVVVADSMQLQRNLVLLAQVLLAGANPVLCLNMADEARAAGQRLDVPMMEKLLGIPVVETVAHRAHGLPELLTAVRHAAAAPLARHRVVLGERLDAWQIAGGAVVIAGVVLVRWRRGGSGGSVSATHRRRQPGLVHGHGPERPAGSGAVG